MNPAFDHLSMKLLLSGNERGLDEIMSRWKAPIAGYLYRMLNNHRDAVELAQEVFVKIYLERKRFDLRKPFSPWIYAIASNLAKNHLRWRSVHKGEVLDETTLPDMQPLTKPTEGLMMDCLQKLSMELREVVTLFDIEERSHEEIARIIGKSRKTVEARLYKAREVLRRNYLRVDLSRVYIEA